MAVAAPPDGDGAAWIGCKCCPEFWCRIHQAHVYECACPSIENWGDTDPYSEGGPKG